MQRNRSFSFRGLRLFVLTIIGILAIDLPTQAGMVLSFGNTEYTANPGDFVNLQVFLNQVTGGPQVDANNPLLSAGIRATYGTGVISPSDFVPNPAFDNVSQSSVAGDWGVTLLSLNGIGNFTNPVLIGVYRFVASSPGVRSISLQDFDANSPDYITLNGDIVDPTNQFTARITVVPEPTSILSMTIGGVIALTYYRRNRKQV